MIEKGQVSVDGALAREPGRLVAETARIEWDPNRPALRWARLELARLWEDDHVLIVDKPAGLLSVPSAPDAGPEDTVLARVAEYVAHLRPGRPYVGVVHRLDRMTSGALAFALSPEARAGLRALIRAHRIERRYLALVAGTPRGEKGVVEVPLADAYRSGRRHVARNGEPARPARTRFRVVERFPGAALLEVELETGRQHQIRIHLAHLGLPILGDRVYGGPRPRVPGAPRQLLHAQRLGFEHPLTGERVRAESGLPEDFRAVLELLRRGRGPRRRSPTGGRAT